VEPPPLGGRGGVEEKPRFKKKAESYLWSLPLQGVGGAWRKNHDLKRRRNPIYGASPFRGPGGRGGKTTI